MELGKKIRQLRYKAKMTQEQLADRLGIGAQSVSKWENSAAMPDITLLPKIAEVFGVTIDDLFDLTTEQQLSRIENRLDIEQDLPQDVFRDYEDFLKAKVSEEEHKKRATYLLAYLWWNRMDWAARKVNRYAKDAVRLAPNEKGCQWMLTRSDGHACWDWNLSNHTKAIDFYRELAEANPEDKMPLYYLIDNLLADHRADEAEACLEKLRKIKDANPVLIDVYPAHIALARFDEKTADAIMDELVKKHEDDDGYLFEAAQYYARKCCYDKAIEIYEIAYEKDPKRPRFIDPLMGIADIWKIRGNDQKAAEAWDRIVDSMKNEWCMEEEVELKDALKIQAELHAKAQNRE